MPQVLTDPTLNPGVITNGGTDLFSYPNIARPSVLALQVPVTQPLPPGTATAANLLSPDLQVAAQLANFPDTVYDLSSSSLLVHFMQALLGAAGTGQLRLRQLVARLQQALDSTRFYDLDGFYGALFGAQRGPDESLPGNPATGLPVSPYTDLASPDAWDEIEAIDAAFREKIIALSRAITLGGTVPGMRALGEAVSGVPCQVYETWRILGNAEGPAPGFQTWQQVMTSYAAWSSFPAKLTWGGVEGYVSFTGLLGNGAPNEVVIQPRKHYSTSAADLARQGADAYGILSVAEVLKPAQTLVSADVRGSATVTIAQMSGAWADSQYADIVHLVTPPSPLSPAYAAISSSYQGSNAQELPSGTWAQPVPPMSRSAGTQYSYASDVTSVGARASAGTTPNAPQVTDGQDYQVIVFPGAPAGVPYAPADAVMPARRAATSRTSSPVSVRCAPYSGPRVPIARAT